jgi:hypothetical protein
MDGSKVPILRLGPRDRRRPTLLRMREAKLSARFAAGI